MDNDFFAGSSASTDIDLSAFFDSSVTEQLCGLLELGVLVSLGVTRDGGALGIAIFNDGRRRREYFRRSEDAADFLRLATESLSGLGVGSNGRNGSRR